MANVSLSAAGDTLYAYLSGEIDHDADQYLRLRIDDALVCRSPRVLVMDFAGVGFMDSSGVGLILGRQRRVRALGGRLQVQHAPPQLRRGRGRVRSALALRHRQPTDARRALSTAKIAAHFVCCQRAEIARHAGG